MKYTIYPYLITANRKYDHYTVVSPSSFDVAAHLAIATSSVDNDVVAIRKLPTLNQPLYLVYKQENVINQKTKRIELDSKGRDIHMKYGFIIEHDKAISMENLPIKNLLEVTKASLQEHLENFINAEDSFKIVKSSPLSVDTSLISEHFPIKIIEDYEGILNQGKPLSKVRDNAYPTKEIEYKKKEEAPLNNPEKAEPKLTASDDFADIQKSTESSIPSKLSKQLTGKLNPADNIGIESNRQWYLFATHDAQGVFHLGRTVVSATVLVAVVFCIAKFTRRHTHQPENTVKNSSSHIIGN